MELIHGVRCAQVAAAKQANSSGVLPQLQSPIVAECDMRNMPVVTVEQVHRFREAVFAERKELIALHHRQAAQIEQMSAFLTELDAWFSFRVCGKPIEAVDIKAVRESIAPLLLGSAVTI